MIGDIIFGDTLFSDSYDVIVGAIWNTKCEVPDDEWQDKYIPSSAKVDICEEE